MKYEGIVYRPPSEAYSLIIQVTIGCSHNKCTFCNMYKSKKFRVRKIDDVIKDLIEARRNYKCVKRIFLADGDALILKNEELKKILVKIQELFPECERIGIYGSPKNILRKTVEELRELKQLGLGIIYLGIESGSDEILKCVNKGVSSSEIVKAGKKVVSSGIKLSVMIISGLGGKEKWKEHAEESARVLNEIDPDYFALLTLLIHPETQIYEDIKAGKVELLNPNEIMIETKHLIKNLKLTNCVFRSNHASNYVALGGVFPKDKEIILKELEKAINEKYDYKDEHYRRL
ncbi:radical SAM protein [Abyssisolibacter fermentans]|uniref:radical SAM protein n=1 Tax=Abyssisolibacter fermentans TaxID=1766203 RepID=UPI00082D93C2|nr:radical SAM protein [Abyssisolibacter fermentans]